MIPVPGIDSNVFVMLFIQVRGGDILGNIVQGIYNGLMRAIGGHSSFVEQIMRASNV